MPVESLSTSVRSRQRGFSDTDFGGRDSATGVTERPQDTATRASLIAAAPDRNLSRCAPKAGAGDSGGGCERWREEMAAKFVPVDIVATAHDYNLTGELTTATVGSISVGELSSSAVDFRRTAANIRRGDMGGVKVSVQLRGRGLIVQNGREAVLNPGDFAVYDTSTPYAMHYASTFDTLVLMFPRTSLKITSDELRKASAQRIPGDHGVGALVSQFLIALRPRLRAGTLSTTPMMEDAILDLISAVAIDNTQFGRIPARASLLVGARTFIGAHLAEPDLDTSKVAAALHISPRYLQKLFAAEGLTVAGSIRSRRLERCRRDFQDARLLGEGVSAIAARHGLYNSAHFSRIFKATYGISPTAYREAFRP
jgi:AraC-like DNA-binding protein